MSNFKSISGLAQIAGNYDVILCDIWGVIHNGNSPYKPATEALELFRSENGPVILISNSPKPSISIPRAFDSIGVFGDFYDAVVTSGDAIINEIARRAPGPVFKLGPDRDDVLYADIDLHFSDIEHASFISCTGMFDDDDKPDDYLKLLTEAKDRSLPFLCANPDVKVRFGGKIVWCGGALAKIYEKIGGEVIYAGKPHDPIYSLTRAWMRELLGYVPPKDRILCIGDNIFTDLLGAQQQDYDCLFIQDGLYGEKEAELSLLLSNNGILSKYMSSNLAW